MYMKNNNFKCVFGLIFTSNLHQAKRLFVCLCVQVTLLHGRGPTCWPERTQRERRLLLLVCIVSVGLFISLITTGVFYKQSELEALKTKRRVDTLTRNTRQTSDKVTPAQFKETQNKHRKREEARRWKYLVKCYFLYIDKEEKLISKSHKVNQHLLLEDIAKKNKNKAAS